MRTACCLVLMALATLAGCSKPTTEGVDGTLLVYSLDPLGPVEDTELEPGEVLFHKYVVIGSTTVTDSERQREIVDGLRVGVEEAHQDPNVHKMCQFSPRHGVRLAVNDGTVNEWLICFACEEVKVFQNGAPLRAFEKSELPTGVRSKTNKGNITRRAQKLLNDTLRNAGVELASGADKGE